MSLLAAIMSGVLQDERNGDSPVGAGWAAEVMVDSPALWLRLAETSGTTAVDSSGNSRDGTYNGGTLGVAGAVAGDLAWESVAKQVTLANTVSSTNPFTIAFWIKAAAFTSSDPTFCCPLSCGPYSSGWYITISDATPSLDFIASGGSPVVVHSSGPLLRSAWNFVVITRSGTTVKIYINGVESMTTALSQPNLAAYTGSLILNGYPGNLYAGSAIYDELLLYNTALSSARVAALYAASSIP